MDETIEELLPFFKALSDANRLKIVGLLARQPLSGEQLAEILGLRPSTISHHLAFLLQAGLVSARPESYYNIYRLETGALDKIAQRLLAHDILLDVVDDVDLDAYDRKVVADYTLPDGHLKTIPAQRKKLEAVLRHVVRAFEPDVRYSEQEVNKILLRFHSDTASLRRELVSCQLMGRESGGGAYWRIEDKQERQ